MISHNPYTLLFGQEPANIIPRRNETAAILSSFLGDFPTQQVYMITGIRGSGKTVLMTEVSRQIREKDEWVVIELNPERSLLEDLATKLNSDQTLVQIFRNAKINLSFFGIGIDISGTSPVTNIETAIQKMLETLQKKGKRILLTIDEAYSTPSMKEFVHSFQIFIRQNLPVFLLMTGLYHNIDTLQNEKGLTFLYRAPKIELQPLSIRTIAQNYQDTFQLDKSSAAAMAAMTKGYSFAFQVLGYLTWEAEGKFQNVISEYQRYLADYAYDKIWSELSDTDRKIAYGIASTPSTKVADIRTTLQIDTNHFNPYRKRLIRKGILNGNLYGNVEFTLPFFKEYILENYYPQ